MTKVYELPEGRRITVDFDENGICKVTVQALDSLIGKLNYYADKVCDIEDIKAEIRAIPYQRLFGSVSCYSMLDVILEIIDKHTAESEVRNDSNKRNDNEQR